MTQTAPKAAHPGISVGGEAGALFVAGIDEPQFAVRQLLIKTQNVVAGNPENVAHTVHVKPVDEVLANGSYLHGLILSACALLVKRKDLYRQ